MTDTPESGNVVEIPLSEMIETLRQELQAAQAQGSRQAVAFNIEKVELELKVAVSRKNKADGKIAFWVINAGGGTERSGESTHTFKLTLTPVSRATGRQLQVSNDTNESPDKN
jgi:hypothetical protein